MSYCPNHTQKLVISLLHARLNNNDMPFNTIPSEQWTQLLEYSTRHRVALLLYDYIKRYDVNIPTEIMCQLKLLYKTNALRNIRFEQELIGLQNDFSAHKINFIIIKGIGLSKYLYHDPALRPCVDIDILVKEPDLNLASTLLAQKGYHYISSFNPLHDKISRKLNHHWQYYNPNKKIMLELHNKFIARSRSSPILLQDTWENASLISLCGREFLLLGPEHLLIYLAIHSSKEFWAYLLQLFDIATLIRINPSLDWQAIMLKAEQSHSQKRLFINFNLLKELFNFKFPEVIESQLKEDKYKNKVYKLALKSISYPHKKSALWSINQWLDLQLADYWRDRFTILAYTIWDQVLKLLEWPTKISDFLINLVRKWHQ